MKLNRNKFIAWELASKDVIDVKRCYIDVAGRDLAAGVLLSQILYYNLPSRDGSEQDKLSIYDENDGRRWLAKKRDDWWDECRLTAREFDRAIRILEREGLVETETRKFNGTPIKHISLNWDVFLNKLETVLADEARLYQTVKSTLPNGEVRLYQTVKSTLPNGEVLYTKTTTKTTNIDNNISADADHFELELEPIKKDRSKNATYYAADYIEGGIQHDKATSDGQKLFAHYMASVYSKRGTNPFFSASEIGRKIMPALNRIIKESGGLEEAKKYVDWYVSSEDPFYLSAGHPIEIMLSNTTRRKYLNGGSKSKLEQHLAKGAATNAQERVTTRDSRRL